jgi:hypothetical protein
MGWGGMDCIDLVQDRVEAEVCCEHSTEPSGSMKCWEVLEQLHKWQLLKKGIAQLSWLSQIRNVNQKGQS